MSTSRAIPGIRTGAERRAFRAEGWTKHPVPYHAVDVMAGKLQVADSTIDKLVAALNKEHGRPGSIRPDGKVEVHPAYPAACDVCVLLAAVGR